MYKLIDDPNVTKEKTNFVFIMHPKLVYNSVELVASAVNPKPAETTLKVINGGYEVTRQCLGELPTVTIVTKFKVSGDFAIKVGLLMEEIKEDLFGENYLSAKKEFEDNQKCM